MQKIKFRYGLLPLLLAVGVLSINTSFDQTPDATWVKGLDVESDPQNRYYTGVVDTLWFMDTASAKSALVKMEKAGASAGPEFRIRLTLLKASVLWRARKDAARAPIEQYFKQALHQAYELNNDDLIALASWTYGETMYHCGDLELAVMYCLNAADIYDKKRATEYPHKYQFVGEILYNTRDYEKSIHYLRRSIETTKDTSAQARIQLINRLNTVALCWQRMGMADSAFQYYGKAMAMAKAANNAVWTGIISGNTGQIYYSQKKYDTAKALLLADYRTSKAAGETASAANSLQWVARISLAQGRRDSALLQVREAAQMLQRQPHAGYLQNLYYATAEVYRALGNNDSFYRYTQLYNHLHDSAERAVANSRLEISRIRLDNQAAVFKIRDLQKEREATALQRNGIIAAILLCAAIALLLLNHKRLQLKHRQQLALQEKSAAEAEVAAARSQLHLFTQSMLEKTALIEQLQERLADKAFGQEQRQLAEELSRQPILTEEDWEGFKTLFEKLYPGFFIMLKETVSDITVAEQRMAALTRLRLTTKEMASMLGISPDSVRKGRQRLRQRLGVETDAHLETYLAGL